jgi:predicted nuclease of predicted toxin-antitoxin system
MRLLCDENIESSLVQALRKASFDVTYISEVSPGVSDEAVLQAAVSENRVLLTADLDFGTLVYQQSNKHADVVIIRLSQLSVSDKSKTVLHVLATYGERITTAFTVISSNSVRIR